MGAMLTVLGAAPEKEQQGTAARPLAIGQKDLGSHPG